MRITQMQSSNAAKVDSNTIIIVSAIVVAALIIGGSIWAGQGNRGGGTNEPIVAGGGLEIGEAPVLGDPQAPNTIVEFLDFQCPYCELFSTETEPQLRELYIDSGKAKLVYKALTFLGAESVRAATAAECAKEQGKYVAMHDAIYEAERIEAADGGNPENSGNLSDAFFAGTAEAIGLDKGVFNACIASDRIKNVLEAYSNDAEAAMGARVSTPTVFVNGTKVANPFDLEEYANLIK
ncbi:hypothetical protein A2755_01195 [Candidatus Wolfebacteria bacterium RIFCSPHIGHO2_01_FULL_48_22]|uniref:Thioredoxin domain-containing protein n=2 Tax=Candidatus Wolfeibacteriota TaxID=1752735 RepID=A0A1F8DX80_9BACT|nr:MAG: hypothetical protein A2755_01195 [Candidatus Wolfebacteria bacterium RIFCSPHIGHO2_01_FULL_48_22]OGM93930.1 MAG: hypothetical protein A2935_03600 [Candidatus Wolfebacteria bacterium RIFCSPLOWO2_01_FULL_47_17b]